MANPPGCAEDSTADTVMAPVNLEGDRVLPAVDREQSCHLTHRVLDGSSCGETPQKRKHRKNAGTGNNGDLMQWCGIYSSCVSSGSGIFVFEHHPATD